MTAEYKGENIKNVKRQPTVDKMKSECGGINFKHTI